MSARLESTAASAPEEASLVVALRRGDRAAAENFVRQFQDRVYRLLFHLVNDPETAMDLTQDTLLKALTAIHDFKGKSGLMTWLYRIATNLALSQRRKNAVRKALSLDASAGAASFADTPTLGERLPAAADHDPQQAEDRLKERLNLALSRLDAESRCILWLRDVEDLDYHQIEEALDLPLGTVKSRLFRARTTMRELLHEVSV